MVAEDQFLAVANDIGAKLCRDALWAGDRCNWLGDSMEFVENDWTVVHRAFGPDFYGGTAGIAFFLVHLFIVTHERLYKKVAEGALEQAISRADDLDVAGQFGFYSGLAGLAYALIKAGECLENERFLNGGFAVLKRAVEQKPTTQNWDVLSGSAGVIPFLLSLHDRYKESFWSDSALLHGNLLLDSAEQDDKGWSWNTLQSPGGKNLTGFSHGTAGIGWALFELWATVKEDKFRVAAEQAFKYEQYWFNKQEKNWPDFRNFGNTTDQNEASAFSVAWCHGAPGIGLSRVRAYEIVGEEAYRREAWAAVRTTAKILKLSAKSKQGNYCLCHGNAGNAELLIYAGDVFKKPNLLRIARDVGAEGIQTYHAQSAPWPCGVLGGGETPNLMLGLAGIGYHYLRLHDPGCVPSALILTSSLPNRELVAKETPHTEADQYRSKNLDLEIAV